MFGRLLPRETSFFDFFEQHATVTVEGAREFLALTSGEGFLPDRRKRIGEIETEADTITHRCVAALHTTFITPIERDDIHLLISRMDDILDSVEEASECIVLYKIGTMTPEVKALAEVLVETSVELKNVVGLMRDMSNAKAITDKCVEIKRLEGKGDTIFRNAVARLFDEEQDLRTLIKWKDVYESLENAIDRCEDVANIIEGVVLEQT